MLKYGYTDTLLGRGVQIDNDDIATWESSGWYPPKEPFVVELAPHELLEKHYRHFEETDQEFKR